MSGFKFTLVVVLSQQKVEYWKITTGKSELCVGHGDSQNGRTDGLLSLVIKTKVFQECQQDVKKSVRQTGRYTDRWADRRSDRETG